MASALAHPLKLYSCPRQGASDFRTGPAAHLGEIERVARCGARARGGPLVERERLAIHPGPGAIHCRVARTDPEAGVIVQRIRLQRFHGAVPTVLIWEGRQVAATGPGIGTGLVPGETSGDDGEPPKPYFPCVRQSVAVGGERRSILLLSGFRGFGFSAFTQFPPFPRPPVRPPPLSTVSTSTANS